MASGKAPPVGAPILREPWLNVNTEETRALLACRRAGTLALHIRGYQNREPVVAAVEHSGSTEEPTAIGAV